MYVTLLKHFSFCCDDLYNRITRVFDFLVKKNETPLARQTDVNFHNDHQ